MSDAGHPYLPKEAWNALHTPEGAYAGGWVVAPERILFTHSGSNTMWFANISISPIEERFALVTTNSASEAAMTTALAISRELMQSSPP